jgi:8-oxo-dGTP pyrophosphatase MutT (NUDIX family)
MAFNYYLDHEVKFQSLIENKLQAHTHKSYRYADVSFVRAAVLIPLFFKEGEAHMLLTRRTDKVEHHKNQIAFPGGRHDANDINLRETAIRETWEEMGIMHNDIKILGQTDDFLTNTNFMITPYVGFIPYPYKYNLNHDEISNVFEIPLRTLLDPQIFEVKPLIREGIHWKLHYYHCDGLVIWGVTGFLLSNFLSIVFNLDRMNEI